MKLSKSLHLIIVLVLCLALVPQGRVSAAWNITGSEVISVDTAANSDWVVKSGGSLTINSGVTVTAACSDADAGGTDTSLVEIIVELGGTLIVDGASIIGATPSTSCWYGIRVLNGGTATIQNSTIRDATRGVVAENSSPTIHDNTITQIHGEDSTTKTTKTAYGILVYGSSASPVITDNTISVVYGGDGCDVGVCGSQHGANAYGIFAADSTNATITGNSSTQIYGGNGKPGLVGENGTPGTTGTLSAPNGTNGTAGSPGGNGGNGGDAYGIYTHTLTGILNNNQVSMVTGGNGANGSMGGTGGYGGNGYNYSELYSGIYDAEGGTGGKGGAGGAGGTGGNGGNAYGYFLWISNLTANNNQSVFIYSGLGRAGGLGGNGGYGGDGGRGTPTVIDVMGVAGYGGYGNQAGQGGVGGNAGSSANAYGFFIEGTTLQSFDKSLVRTVTTASAGNGGFAGDGNVGGDGGPGGTTHNNVGYIGGGGGDAFAGAPGGIGGAGGSTGNGYGIYINNTTVSEISRAWVEDINSGLPGGGGRGGKGGNGGKGGAASTNRPAARGGHGGAGGISGIGGSGGSSGNTYGIFVSGTNTKVTNSIIYDVESKAGANGGPGYDGGNGGNGGSGGTVEPKPGGNGGNGGNSGNGGAGGTHGKAFGVNVISASTVNHNFFNNTIVNVKASLQTTNGGLAGTTFGIGGLGGAGSTPGANGLPGILGVSGANASRGYSLGLNVETNVKLSFYNNILADFHSSSNSTGVGSLTSSNLSVYYSNLYGWNTALGPSVTEKTGTSYTDPLFIDVSTQNFRLQSISPCIDTGFAVAGAPSMDYSGVPRPLDGDGDSTAIFDRGVYEYGNFFMFNQETQQVGEGDYNITLTIQRVGYSDTVSSVQFTTSDITTTAGEDYPATTSTASFPGGVGGVFAYVLSIYDDALVEGNETFKVSLHTPVNGVVSEPDELVVTIIDDEMIFIFLPMMIR